MRIAIPPFPQCAFMAWCSVKICTETTLSSHIISRAFPSFYASIWNLLERNWHITKKLILIGPPLCVISTFLFKPNPSERFTCDVSATINTWKCVTKSSVSQTVCRDPSLKCVSPCSRAFLVKLIVTQIGKRFLNIYGTEGSLLVHNSPLLYRIVKKVSPIHILKVLFL